jgi:hypothetical protein
MTIIRKRLYERTQRVLFYWQTAVLGSRPSVTGQDQRDVRTMTLTNEWVPLARCQRKAR